MVLENKLEIIFEDIALESPDISGARPIPLLVNQVVALHDYLFAETDLHFSEVNVEYDGVTLVIVLDIALADEELSASHED